MYSVAVIFLVVCVFPAILVTFNCIKTQPVSGKTNAIMFDQILTSVDDAFVKANNSLSATGNSVWWWHMGVDVPPSTFAFLHILNLYPGQNMTIMKRNRAIYAGLDSLTYDGIIKLATSSNSLTLATDYATYGTMNNRQSYWAGFRLDNFFRPLIAFRVTRSSPVYDLGPYTYDTVLVNEGSGWDTARNAFIAPVSGVYFFTVSGGITNAMYTLSVLVNSVLNCNIKAGIGALLMVSETDLVTGACFLQMSKGDNVTSVLTNGSPMYSTPLNNYISFSAFCYNPSISQKVYATFYVHL